MEELRLKHWRRAMVRQLRYSPQMPPLYKFKKSAKPGRYALLCLTL
jgi:hypothetical protein